MRERERFICHIIISQHKYKCNDNYYTHDYYRWRKILKCASDLPSICVSTMRNGSNDIIVLILCVNVAFNYPQF